VGQLVSGLGFKSCHSWDKEWGQCSK